MKYKIAAANWKMNLTWQEGKLLLERLKDEIKDLEANKKLIVSVPFPYLSQANELLQSNKGFYIAAQNIHHKPAGAFTGEVSASMLTSLNISYVIIGHSERRELFFETNDIIAQKVKIALENNLKPIFCCGEPLEQREAGTQNLYVQNQIEQSLFGLNEQEISNCIIAYEPIWAIGTGKTASAAQAQEMHQFIRKILVEKYGENIASSISILYGGSVKANNAIELFAENDIDGALVGGASLIAEEFKAIVNSL